MVAAAAMDKCRLVPARRQRLRRLPRGDDVLGSKPSLGSVCRSTRTTGRMRTLPPSSCPLADPVPAEHRSAGNAITIPISPSSGKRTAGRLMGELTVHKVNAPLTRGG